MTKPFLLFIFLLFPVFFFAQQITNAFHWQSDFPLSFDTQTLSSDGQQFIGGTFREQLDTSSTAIGGSDIFITSVDAEGTINWIRTGGSARNDLLVKIAYSEQQIFATGTYWIQGIFEDLVLETKGSAQGIFLLNYNENGAINWGLTINGTGSKEIQDLEIDKDGNLLLAGSFQGTLVIGNDTLNSLGQSFFLLKLTPNGQLLWSQQADRVEGITNGVALTTLANGRIILTGTFIGQLEIDNNTILTDTEDEDVFIVAYSDLGDFLWLKEAGGVFSDFVRDISSVEDQFFIAGNFTGRMEINEQLILESAGLNENIFLIAFDENANAIWGKSIGGRDIENMTSLEAAEDQIVLGGFFQNRFETEGFELVGLGNSTSFDGFVLNYDLSGTINWLKGIGSDEALFVKNVAIKKDQNISIIGDFIGNAQFDNFNFSSSVFNPFAVELSYKSTSTNAPILINAKLEFLIRSEELLLLSPIDIEYLQLFDLQGKLLITTKNQNTINLTNLPNGFYAIRLVTSSGMQFSDIFIVAR